MDIMNFSALESTFLSTFNNGYKSYEDLLEHTNFNEKTLSIIIEGLLSKNIIEFNTTKKEYQYQTKVEGEIVLLDGNVMLPTTIIRQKNELLVCRGEWYSFPLDFDVRRIIWNVKLDQKTNSTLVDLIQSSILKTKKPKIQQLPEYEGLKNKVVPYSDNISLSLKCIGEEITDVHIMFKIKISLDSDISVEHRGFVVPSEISTDQLIDELKKPVAERNYSENIKLNKMFNFSDFIFSNNEIPISHNDNVLTYFKITGIRKSLEITYYKMDISGNKEKLDVENFIDYNDGIDKIRELFRGFPEMILSDNHISVEMTE